MFFSLPLAEAIVGLETTAQSIDVCTNQFIGETMGYDREKVCFVMGITFNLMDL